MGFFDDYDIIGGLCDLATAPFKAADEILFGPPGEVSGLLGTPLKAIVENPGETTAIVAAVALTGGTVLLVAPGIVAAVGGAGVAGGALSGVATGSAGLVAGVSTSSLLNAVGSAGVRAAAVNLAGFTAKQATWYAAAGFVAQQPAGHVIDNYFREKVHPVMGCVVYCDLGAIAEHSGVYVGGDSIVHLDGSGSIEIVTREKFISRLGGINPAMSIYVSCSDDSSIGDIATAERALAMVGGGRNYNVIIDNCHQFTSGCITGNFENSDNFWWMLKRTTQKHYESNSWRVWG